MRKNLLGVVIAVLAAAIALSSPGARSAQPAAQSTTAISPSKVDALRSLDDFSANLAKLQDSHAKMVALNGKMEDLLSSLLRKAEDTSRVAANAPNLPNDLKQALHDLHETQMSFNLQYLQLQSSMQNENRQFTMVSNIMKTKNDTVKNSISNIR